MLLLIADDCARVAKLWAMNAIDSAATPATAVAAVPRQLLIDGWRDAAERRTFAVEDPATGQTLCEVADASIEDGRKAVEAAAAAQDAWAAVAPRDRGEMLRGAYERIVQRADELALVMTLEMGKPLSESRSEVLYAADFLHWFAGEATRIDGRYGRSDRQEHGRVLVARQPVGPALLITPWNFPMAMGARKVGPAIAAGCTMVVKPAKQTPLSMLALAQILREAGVPDGVLNVVTTSSSGSVIEPLLRHPALRKLSFTGSTEVGQLLMQQSTAQLLRVSMELGGNAPFIVFADANVDSAVDGAVIAKMRNGGEACTAANRFYVHEAVADEFSSKLAGRLGAMRVGPGTKPGVHVGPLIDDVQRGKVAELVDDAVARGASVLTGGSAVDGAGYFFEPTVLSDVPDGARVLSEEIFGPVAPIRTFADDDEVIAEANDTQYGLVAYIYTESLRRAMRSAERLETGMLGVNQGLVSAASAPFGGIKHSGFGREGGREGIDEYLNTKYIALNLE